MKPEVSIVMPVHDAEAFLEEAVASVQAQTLEAWELLVVDDASMDASAERVARMAGEDERIWLIRLAENGGAAIARNTGIREARGRYIAFLDSDDRWLLGKLERQLAFMQARGAAFSFTAMERVDEAGAHLAWAGVPERVGHSDLLKTNYVGCSTAMYDTALVGKVEMPLIRRRQDYGLWLKLLRQVDYAFGLNEALTQYRVRAGSVSSNKLDTSRYTWRVYRDVVGLSLPESAYCYAHQTGRALLRNRFPSVARRLGLLHPVGSA
ncbi:glycosyltransferase family 2 protein [Thioalkalivibrio sp. ALM2T]|uniref:glycosyltransferase family 2 protein n=1 Tax=Thioalkalivibrio sp. ALM2T TaxID=1158184 RepID=UPI0009D96D0E|nr:glycosyltransferase family 2 protein [Thioalkalivibrio sp. ALM2T]